MTPPCDLVAGHAGVGGRARRPRHRCRPADAGSAAPYALGVARADLDKQPTDVRRMFDAVARRYDVTNDVLSLGQDRRWRTRGDRRRRPAPGRAGPRPRRRHRHLEPAVRRRAARRSCRATSRSACCRSASRHRPHLPFTAGDGTRLPFADDTFDAVTISFGLRNIVDPGAGLREMRRVTRPGGRLVVCEFSHPTWAPFRTVYVEYLMKALPADRPRGLVLSPDAYVYLAESIRAWPDQAGLADLIAERRLAAAGVAQPLRRHRRPAPRDRLSPSRAPIYGTSSSAKCRRSAAGRRSARTPGCATSGGVLDCARASS